MHIVLTQMTNGAAAVVARLPVMKMSVASLFSFPSSSVTSLFALIEWSVRRGLAPPLIVSICIFMFLLNGLRQSRQQIPWQTVYFFFFARPLDYVF